MNIPVHPSLTSIRGHSSVLNSHDVVPKLSQSCPKVVSMFFGKAPKVASEPKTVSLAIYPAMTVKVQLWYKRCLNYSIFIEVKNAFKMLSFFLLLTHVLPFWKCLRLKISISLVSGVIWVFRASVWRMRGIPLCIITTRFLCIITTRFPPLPHRIWCTV